MHTFVNLRHCRTLIKLNTRLLLVLSILLGTICYYNVSKGTASTTSATKKLEPHETVWINDDDIIYSAFQTAAEHERNSVSNENLSRKEITISLYNKKEGNRFFNKPEKILTAQQCTHLGNSNMFTIPCRITSEEKYFNDSDAIVFHSRELKNDRTEDWIELPQGYRNEKQLWVYFQPESQIYTFPDLKNYPNVFNWTMTLRRDSDVYRPHGYFVPLSSDGSSTKHDLLTSTLTNKTGMVAWIVSHCNPRSKRDHLVRELKKYITVDVFGDCGKPCPSDDCYGYVASKYKMYLSFENSLCTDYITEKFYDALLYNMLPIVYGGGKSETGQDYSEVAPVGSYINARSFNDAKDLANYILHVNKNDAEFLRYFEWKKKFQVVPLNDSNFWCSICQKLYEHVNKFPSQVKWYKDLWSWWNYVEVEEKNELKAGGNQATSSFYLGQKFKRKTRACASPPSNLIRTDEK